MTGFITKDQFAEPKVESSSWPCNPQLWIG